MHLHIRWVIIAEITAVAVALVALAAGIQLAWAAAVGVLLAAAVFLVAIRDVTLWQWAVHLRRWIRRRTHRLLEVMKPPSTPDTVDDDAHAEAADGGERDDTDKSNDTDDDRTDGFANVVVNDATQIGVLVDDHTVVTMVALWGKAYLPTLLTPDRAETPNTVALSAIAGEMQRASLGVDVDVVAEGARTYTGDAYGAAFNAFVANRAIVGQRSTTLIVRLDTHASDTTAGLMWRPNSVTAAIAATQRIVKALQQAGCRAEILTEAQMRNSTAAAVGGQELLEATYHDRWTTLHQPGHGFTTSYYVPAIHLTARALEDLWSIDAEHTTVVIALRRHRDQVRVGALVRLITNQPIRTTPATTLRRCTGRQWDALSRTIPGAPRLTTALPSIGLTDALDDVVAVGPTGVLIGATRDDHRTGDPSGLVLIPISDPAQPTRIAANVDDLIVRQLIRRASAAGELVAVYDETGRWAMTGASSRIWTTSDSSEQPPRPPTVVVHRIGLSNPHPGARSAIAIGPPRKGYNPDIWIDQHGAKTLQLNTRRFDVALEPITIRGEAPATAPARPLDTQLIGTQR
jgi:type VII secretion protein EccE